MRRGRFVTTLIASFALLAACSNSEPNDPAPPASPFERYADAQALRAHLAAVRDGYVGAMRAVGVSPPFEPRVEVRTSPNVVYYADETVYAPLYDELPADFRNLLAEWAGGAAQGEVLFAALFHWFFVAHELSHYLQDVRGVVWDAYDYEQHANDAAVAYWMSTPDGAQKLERLDALLAEALPRMKSQVFPGGLDRGIFNRKKSEIDLVPAEYGFAQFTMVRDAIARRAALTREAAIAKATEGGVDCAPIGPRIEEGCPATPNGVAACRATMTFLGQRHVSECDATRATLLECYVGATEFSCSPNPDVPPLPPTCEQAVGAHLGCLQSNGAPL